MNEYYVNLPEGIEQAMMEFEDDNSDVSLEERFDKLMEAMMAFAFVMIDRHRRTGLRIGEHEKQWQEDSMEQLRAMEKVMAMAKKYNRISSNKPNNNFTSQTVSQIQSMKSTVGEIIRKVPKINESTGEPE